MAINKTQNQENHKIIPYNKTITKLFVVRKKTLQKERDAPENTRGLKAYLKHQRWRICSINDGEQKTNYLKCFSNPLSARALFYWSFLLLNIKNLTL